MKNKVTPLNKDQLNLLSRHLADANSEPLLEKRSILKSIRSFCKKPWVMSLLYILKIFVLFSFIGVVALLTALYVAGYFS